MSSHQFKLALVAALATALAGCEPPPEYIENCLESHTESYVAAVPKIVAPGTPSVGGLAFVRRERTVCDKSEVIPNPAYAEWIRKHGAGND
jgi:hypothetical protein